MLTEPIDNWDVAVIGGGPAGTTAATLLARRGRRVVLFERDRHPRFHIGESLLPMNLPIFAELGVLDDIERIGVCKPAADFTPSSDTDACTSFTFAHALGDSPPYAFQVRRSEFDQLLFENCRRAGVNVLERVSVTAVKLSAPGTHVVQATDDDGNDVHYRCRYLLDASGQQTLLASQQQWRTRNRKHAAAAVFTHFEGAVFRDGDAAGNISIYWFDQGWIWMIPLRDGVMSIGAVCRPQYLKTRSGSLDEFLRQTIARSGAAASRVRDARQVEPVRVAANYSYASRRQTGPGYALIGDAYAFIDPIFSSGVYLAMSSAARIVPVAENWLEGRRVRHQLAAWHYRRAVSRGLATYSWFIYRFTRPAMRLLFKEPHNVLGVEQAVVSILAGDVYESWRIRLRFWLFKGIYAIAVLITACRKSDSVTNESRLPASH